MHRRLRFGFSPCPNDTFAFWAAVHGEVPIGPDLVPELADIEALNQRVVDGGEHAPEVSKLSLPALAVVLDRYAVLASGAALGFGCGPLVVCREAAALQRLGDLAHARVAIPGRLTTAWLLLSSLAPTPPSNVVPMRFDRIVAAVAAGECDAGLIIHESRFTYRQHGLRALCDLGELWERRTGGPLPLGVIAARRDLPAAEFLAVSERLAASVRLARAQPERPWPYVRQHAQELSDDVCRAHIDLYVNAFTADLGSRGRAAIVELLQQGRAAGLLPPGPSPFQEDL